MKRNFYIDTVKGFTILGVFVIHLITALYPSPYDLSGQGILYRVLQQTLRFAVPVFVALSGYLLVGSYQRSNGSISSFFKKRVVTLLPLYFLWTYLFLVFFRLFPGGAHYYDDKPWWLVWFLGAGDYQLYYVPMIFSLYCIFPLLFTAIKRSPFFSLTLCFIAQLILYLYISTNPKTPSYLYIDQYFYRILISWIWYFASGIAIGINTKLVTKISYVFIGYLIIFGLITSIIQGELMIRLGGNIVPATLTTRIPIMIFCTGMIAYFLKRSIDMPLYTQSIWSFLGKHSYLIFLSHTMVIWVIQLAVKRQQIASLSLAVFAAGLGLSVIVQKLQARYLG